MSTLIEMLAQARSAGLRLTCGEDGTLHVRGPRTAEPLVRALLDRKADVLAVRTVYDGTAALLDWRRERILNDPRPCVFCRRNTLLIEPYDGRPCHKICAEAAIRWGALAETKEHAAR